MLQSILPHDLHSLFRKPYSQSLPKRLTALFVSDAPYFIVFKFFKKGDHVKENLNFLNAPHVTAELRWLS